MFSNMFVKKFFAKKHTKGWSQNLSTDTIAKYFSIIILRLPQMNNCSWTVDLCTVVHPHWVTAGWKESKVVPVVEGISMTTVPNNVEKEPVLGMQINKII